MHILELIIMLAVCGGSAVAVHFTVRRWPRVRFPILAVGFVLLALNLLSRLMTDRFYILFPESFSTEILYACSFILVGVLSARYLDTSTRRIIFLVFAIVLSYFTLADHVYFAVAADRVKSLDGKVLQGVTIQSSGFSCVPCSLATVLRRWGLDYTEGEIAYAVRSSFRGTSRPRVPGAVRKLGASKKLQAKVIRTTWEELRKFDVPCLFSTVWLGVNHCTAIIGLDDENVVAGEPQMGLVRIGTERFHKDWKWDGYAVVVAPDFLHCFSPSDTGERCEQLFESLKSLGYDGRDTETVKRFQREYGLEESGVLNWRTILVIDSLAGPPERPRLSTCAESFEEQPEK
jgi:predicted double-glycine peptidase